MNLTPGEILLLVCVIVCETLDNSNLVAKVLDLYLKDHLYSASRILKYNFRDQGTQQRGRVQQQEGI